jgi:hypothetical protein
MWMANNYSVHKAEIRNKNIIIISPIYSAQHCPHPHVCKFLRSVSESLGDWRNLWNSYIADVSEESTASIFNVEKLMKHEKATSSVPPTVHSSVTAEMTSFFPTIHIGIGMCHDRSKFTISPSDICSNIDIWQQCYILPPDSCPTSHVGRATRLKMVVSGSGLEVKLQGTSGLLAFWTSSIGRYSTKHNVSKVGSVSVLRWWGGSYLLWWVR